MKKDASSFHALSLKGVGDLIIGVDFNGMEEEIGIGKVLLDI